MTNKYQLINLLNTSKKFKTKKININYNLNKPLGVRGRSSDNTYVKKCLNGNIKYLSEGLKKHLRILADIRDEKKPNNLAHRIDMKLLL